MSLKEKQRRARQRLASLDDHHDDDAQVLTFLEWCRLNRISPRTGRRIIAAGGVIVTQLSERRIGITRGNNARFQRERERAA
jgi:hypothetical protein